MNTVDKISILNGLEEHKSAISSASSLEALDKELDNFKRFLRSTSLHNSRKFPHSGNVSKALFKLMVSISAGYYSVNRSTVVERIEELEKILKNEEEQHV